MNPVSNSFDPGAGRRASPANPAARWFETGSRVRGFGRCDLVGEGGGGKSHIAKVGFRAWTCKREEAATLSISEFARRHRAFVLTALRLRGLERQLPRQAGRPSSRPAVEPESRTNHVDARDPLRHRIYRAELSTRGRRHSTPNSRPPACPSPRTTRRDSAGAPRTAIRAIPPTPRSTTCPGACRSSAKLVKGLDAHVKAFAKELDYELGTAKAHPRQPVDQYSAAGRRAYLAHPSAFGDQRHLLCDHSRTARAP